MDFDENARLDTSQVEDTRASGGGMRGGLGGGLGAGGLGIPGGGLTVGGGAVGLVIAVVAALLGFGGGLPSGGADGLSSGAGTSDTRSLEEKCAPTNPNRFQETDCRQVATFNDLQSYWRRSVPQTLGVQYRDPRFQLFRQSVQTGCGAATSAVGPFYCPADQRIYIDLSFYDELASQFGAPGEFAQAYVLAHEFGHHLQTLTGASAQVRRLQQQDPDRANQYSIRLELQADCYAGVWTKAASGPDGIVGEVSQRDITEALGAASAVGDDRIQEKAQGQVNPETWTHGSAADRQKWFTTGYSSGDPRRCDTFAR